jgi:TetR/AcrR family transcriptional repressor of nem operon
VQWNEGDHDHGLPEISQTMTSALGSREKILRCAYELFYCVGYHSTSVDDILRECGVAKSNFYYHFRTKDDLALEVLKLRMAEFEQGVLRALGDRDSGPPQRFERFCEALLAVQSEILKLGGCPFGNFAASLPSRSSDDRTQRFREALSHVFVQVHSQLTLCIADGAACGVFRDDLPPEELAITVFAAIEGLMLMTKTQRSPMPLKQGLPVLQMLLSSSRNERGLQPV